MIHEADGTRCDKALVHPIGTPGRGIERVGLNKGRNKPYLAVM